MSVLLWLSSDVICTIKIYDNVFEYGMHKKIGTHNYETPPPPSFTQI